MNTFVVDRESVTVPAWVSDHDSFRRWELEGSPDMVMEIVSTSSVKKDKVILPPLYWQASIAEYWLVDVREERMDFDIFRRGPKNYVPVRKAGGWLKSGVFDLSFRLERKIDKRGNPVFSLLVR